MPKLKLTQDFVDSAAAGGKQRETFYDTALPNFGFYVLKDTPKGPGKKVFFIRYVDDAGVQKGPYGVGDARVLKLKDARDTAKVMLGKAAGGADLWSEKDAKRKALAESRERTLRWVVERYKDTAEWRDKRPKTQSTETERLKTLVLPILGDTPVKEITAASIRLMMDQVWKERTPIRAGHARAALRTVLSYALSMGWVEFNATPPKPNPKTKAGERHRVLTDQEIAAVWTAAGTSRIRDALRLALLSTTRAGETIAAEWSEFDLDARVWFIPAAHTKKNRPHSVYLSDQAVALLERMKLKRRDGDGPWLFPNREGTGPIKTTTMPEACHRIAAKISTSPGDWFSPHDFRRTATTRLAAMGITNAREVLERMLGHVSDGGSKSFKHYQKYTFAKEIGAALQMWADEVQRIAEGRAPEQGANVYSIADARRERVPEAVIA